MEHEILNICAYVGAISVLCIAIYILFIQYHACENLKKEKVKIGVIISEPVGQIINESDGLPVAEEVEEYLNVNKV